MAARALFEAQIARLGQDPARSAAKDLTRVAKQLQAAIWIDAACLRVAEGCFELAGSRAVYETSPLQRRVRDLRVASQHAADSPRHNVMVGAELLARLS
jgi:indole-3-acetate monooxygenase